MVGNHQTSIHFKGWLLGIPTRMSRDLQLRRSIYRSLSRIFRPAVRPTWLQHVPSFVGSIRAVAIEKLGRGHGVLVISVDGRNPVDKQPPKKGCILNPSSIMG